MWLTDPARRFPVIIDPYVGQVASFDTYVASGTTTDLSTSTKLALGTQNSGSTKRIPCGHGSGSGGAEHG